MKKKIKDLTLRECQKICEKRKRCEKCPMFFMFFEFINGYNHCPFIVIDGEVKDIYLEREVEVDE